MADRAANGRAGTGAANGLPLGHQVEVWLLGGIRLRGRLRLEEEVLFIDEERVRHWDWWSMMCPSLIASWNLACGWIEPREQVGDHLPAVLRITLQNPLLGFGIEVQRFQSRVKPEIRTKMENALVRNGVTHCKHGGTGVGDKSCTPIQSKLRILG